MFDVIVLFLKFSIDFRWLLPCEFDPTSEASLLKLKLLFVILIVLVFDNPSLSINIDWKPFDIKLFLSIDYFYEMCIYLILYVAGIIQW